jgi:CDP-paratose 2-epimerase
MLEAISIVEELSGKKLNYSLSEQNRSGDHIWWISDVRKFQQHYPQWSFGYDIRSILREIVEATRERVG